MNRQERRKFNKGKPRVLVTSEVFMTSNLGKNVIYFDVGRMRKWAEQNLFPQKIQLDEDHCNRLIDSGTVDLYWVVSRKVDDLPKRILICEHPDGLGDELVDGNHSYVGAAIRWRADVKQGFVSGSSTPYVEGYGLTPDQWRPFVVPPSRLRLKR